MIITKYTELERLTTIASQFLIFVHQRNMNAQSIFTLECFLAMITIVAEMTREVNTFNVVPGIIEMCIFFSTDVALVARPPVLKLGLLHVLVKHLSSSKMS